MLPHLARFSVVLTALAVVSACGGPSPDASQSVSPAKPSPTSTASPPPPIVAPAQLQPGDYPTSVHPPQVTAGDEASGAVLDARRLAGYVVGPWEVDSRLAQPFVVAPVLVLNNSDALGQIGPDSIAQAAGRHRFINGFVSTRQSADKLVLADALLQFADADDAKRAAAEMNDAALATPIKGGTPKPVAIPGHPDTLASIYQVPSGNRQRSSVRAFTARGNLVLMQLAQGPAGADAAEALVAKAIDAQLPKLDGFVPVDPAALAAVAVDPTGLLARTLPARSNEPSKNAVYSADAAVHFQVDPIASAKTFQDNGVRAISMGLTNVFQTKDPWAAVHVVDAFAAEQGTRGQSAAAVPGLPLSKCVSLASAKRFYCVVPAGDYAIEADATNLQDAHEEIAAQYILLTAPTG